MEHTTASALPDFDRLPSTSVTHLSLRAAELHDGSEVTWPVTVLRGSRPGPALYLGAAIHGDEVVGIDVIRRILNGIDARHMAGSLVAVPVQNPLAFRQRQRLIPADVFDGFAFDLHGAFPGDADGEVGARLAHTLLTDLILRCDFALDLHGPLHGGRQIDYAFTPSPAADRTGQALEMARAFGCRLVVAQNTGGYVGPSMLHQVATDRGVPTIGIEFAIGGRFSGDCARVGVAGVTNVMHMLGMLEGTAVPPKHQLVSGTISWARASRGGILEVVAELGSTVAAGETVAKIYDLSFEQVETIAAPASGLLYRLAIPRPVSASDRIAGVAEGDDAG